MQRKRKKAGEEEEGSRRKGKEGNMACSRDSFAKHSLEIQVGDGEIVQDANGEISAGCFLVATIIAHLWSAVWYTDARVCCVAVASGSFTHLSTQIFATFLE